MLEWIPAAVCLRVIASRSPCSGAMSLTYHKEEQGTKMSKVRAEQLFSLNRAPFTKGL